MIFVFELYYKCKIRITKTYCIMNYNHFRSVGCVLVCMVGCFFLSSCGCSRQQAKSTLMEKAQQQVTENQFLSLDQEEMEKITRSVIKARKYSDKFNSLFDKWMDEWVNGSMKFSSNSMDATKLEEYKELVNMGDKVLPLVVEKLLDKKNFIAVHLYNALQKDKLLISLPELVMQDRAASTVKLWVAAQK